MFKKISEAYAVLSNDKRRKRYDLFGETCDDGDDGEDIFSSMFGDIFGAGGFGGPFGSDEDFESFMNILEKDNIKSFDKMFRTLGKGYRTGPGKYNHAGGLRTRGKKNKERNKKMGMGGGGKGGPKDEEDMMEEMMAMMMMGSMGLDEDDPFGDDPFGFPGMMPPGMMPPGMMPPGMKMPPGFPGSGKSKKPSKTKKETKKPKKDDSDDGWETNSEEDVIDSKINEKKDDDKIQENK